MTVWRGPKDWAGFVEYWKPRVDARLAELLDGIGKAPPKVREAMRYSVFSGGKRLRPIMLLAAAGTTGVEPASVPGLLDAACGIEMIHTYSLIHDDLPCMDDDDFRRGKPTNHKVYGEATAVLAGDALLTMAFEVFSRVSPLVEPLKILRVINLVAVCAGPAGMLGGQVMDMAGRDEMEDGG